jgi:hypothetical protein
VTFTTDPFTDFNSSIRPRAIMIGAKKLTRNTCSRHRHRCRSSRAARRSPFRRNRRVVDQRMQSAAVEPLADHINGPGGILVIREIDLDMVFRPRFPRACSGNG